jgi:hypothetical protein
MKKTMLYICLFLNCLTSCSLREQTIKGYGNPEISQYMKWSSQILSSRTEENIIPIYEITLSKKTDNIITSFEFDVSYYYGQVFQFNNKASFIWDKDSPELIELNSSGSITIRKELFPIKREELVRIEDMFTFTEPDGEDLQGYFKKISFVRQRSGDTKS